MGAAKGAVLARSKAGRTGEGVLPFIGTDPTAGSLPICVAERARLSVGRGGLGPATSAADSGTAICTQSWLSRCSFFAPPACPFCSRLVATTGDAASTGRAILR